MQNRKRNLVLILLTATTICTIIIFLLTLSNKSDIKDLNNPKEESVVAENNANLGSCEDAYKELKKAADEIGNEVSVTYYFPSGETATFYEPSN